MTKTLPEVRGTLAKERALDSLTWLRVGGPAEWFFMPADPEDLAAFLKGTPEDIPVMPMGVGSNLIVRDGGIDGVVIRMGRNFNQIHIEGDRVTAGAAALDAQVAKKAADAGIDLTFLRTIPGSIGGAVRMNAGCYGGYMADVFVGAKGLTRQGEPVEFTAADLGFAYRSSTIPDGVIITEVTMTGPTGDAAGLHAKMEKQIASRDATQPTKDRTAGSTFRNPAGFSSTGQDDDTHDLKAWKVIDDAGLRGFSLGGAQMSPKHPNFLVNTGTATAEDLENLGQFVIKKVFDHSGIKLEWEIMRVGKKIDP
ncbi:UDP-N-acetylmuramate dehydrogenase [Amaricoccus tamworthensis]|uniref:UDP-N-acetylmuramate dehydrogenase n=1 Tax=Amaricoccus tamworthensis TaxID=57002 RepID=UPI003C7ED0B8